MTPFSSTIIVTAVTPVIIGMYLFLRSGFPLPRALSNSLSFGAIALATTAVTILAVLTVKAASYSIPEWLFKILIPLSVLIVFIFQYKEHVPRDKKSRVSSRDVMENNHAQSFIDSTPLFIPVAIFYFFTKTAGIHLGTSEYFWWASLTSIIMIIMSLDLMLKGKKTFFIFCFSLLLLILTQALYV